MTNLEAVIATIGITGYNKGTVTKALIDFGVDPAGLYTAGNTTINKAALQVLEVMRGIKKIAEGDYSIDYNVDARIQDIETGLGTGQPAIRNKSYLW